jgi:hypothetical protein
MPEFDFETNENFDMMREHMEILRHYVDNRIVYDLAINSKFAEFVKKISDFYPNGLANINSNVTDIKFRRWAAMSDSALSCLLDNIRRGLLLNLLTYQHLLSGIWFMLNYDMSMYDLSDSLDAISM